MTDEIGERKRFLFVMWDGGGNVPPELAVARRLVARGHAVRVLGDPTLEPEARGAGCSFSAWTTAPHRTSRDRSDDVFKDYEFKNPLAMLGAYLRVFLAEPAPRWIADTLGELAARPVDAVVVDFAIPAALVAAEKLGLPSATLMPNIYIIPTPGIPPMGPGFMQATGWATRLRDRLMLALTTRLFNKALPATNAARALHGLPPRGDIYEQFLAADELLVQTVPRFDFTSPAMPAKVLYVGPELDDPAWSAPWASPFEPGDRRPLVLVGLGSTFQDQAATLRRIVAALARLPVRAVLTRGPTIRPDEVEGASNVVVVASAPHSQLLREASLLVTHCGHGTTIKGLAAGVPLVCMPMGRDQNDTAARVVTCGAGLRLAPSESSARIERAVRRVLDEPTFKAAAQRMAEAIASREGCTDAVGRLEALAARSALDQRAQPAEVRAQGAA